MLKAFEGTAAEPVAVVNARVAGLPYPLAAAGVPTVGYVAVGDFIMSAPPDGHLDKLSKTRLHGEVTAFARAVAMIDGASPAALKR
jgi:hypothetical protein